MRDKTELKSLGLDGATLVRGRLSHPRALVSDYPEEFPAFGEIELLCRGREWMLISASSSQFVVSGDARYFVIVGDVIQCRDAGDATGDFTVTAISYASGQSTITVEETIGTLTLDSVGYGSRITTDTIRPARWMTHNVLSVNTVANTITIARPNTSSTWPSGSWTDYDAPIQSADMFLRSHRMLWAGCDNASNNGEWTLRDDWTEVSTTRTLYLEGVVGAASTLGTVTLIGPAPLRFDRFAMATHRQYLGSVQPGALVWAIAFRDESEFPEIVSADWGPSAPPGPEE